MWKRGNLSRSRSRTLRPRRASAVAAEEPPGPPPITATSKSHPDAMLGAALGACGHARVPFCRRPLTAGRRCWRVSLDYLRDNATLVYSALASGLRPSAPTAALSLSEGEGFILIPRPRRGRGQGEGEARMRYAHS